MTKVIFVSYKKKSEANDKLALKNQNQKPSLSKHILQWADLPSTFFISTNTEIRQMVVHRDVSEDPEAEADVTELSPSCCSAPS